jgi:hypothetical protein
MARRTHRHEWSSRAAGDRRSAAGGSNGLSLCGNAVSLVVVCAIAVASVAAQPDSQRQETIHGAFSVQVPPTVSVRQYVSSDSRVAAFLSASLEMHVAWGEGAESVPGPKDVLVRRTAVQIDRRQGTIELWKPAVPRRPIGRFELHAKLEGPKSRRLDARAWCQTEADCAVAEAILKSARFVERGNQ